MLAVELHNHFMIHSFHVGAPPSTFLAGAAVEEFMRTRQNSLKPGPLLVDKWAARGKAAELCRR